MRVLIIGFGFSGRAIASLLAAQGHQVMVTCRNPAKAETLQAEGWQAFAFDGTSASPEFRAAFGVTDVLVMAAPPGEAGDPLLATPGLTLADAASLNRVLYLSTVGVYGDHDGAWVDEETPPRPVAARSHARLATERAWQAVTEARGVDLGIFRLSGIYGPGRSAIEALRAGTARRLVKPGQVFNRIHVADIARAVASAIATEGPLGTFNLTDDEPAPPQDVVAYAASLLGLAPPPEMPFEAAELTPMARSFYGENKRVSNARIKRLLAFSFLYPSYREGITACVKQDAG